MSRVAAEDLVVLAGVALLAVAVYRSGGLEWLLVFGGSFLVLVGIAAAHSRVPEPTASDAPGGPRISPEDRLRRMIGDRE